MYIKNYTFDFDFGRLWGRCNVVMTSVSGHLTDIQFGPEYNNWSYPPPESLFDAPTFTTVDEVCFLIPKTTNGKAKIIPRKMCQ